MIHTSYVPLDPPYRVIEYNTTLGIQIGTLIVTRELETKEKDGYSIETHSHPVVSYVNNQYKPQSGPMALHRLEPIEGVVWDKVEVGEVNTIARVGETLRWSDAMSIFKNWRIASELGIYTDVDMAICDTIGQLNEWNVKIPNPVSDDPKKNKLFVELSTEKHDEKLFVVGTGGLGLAVLTERKDFVRRLLGQAHWYWATLSFFHPKESTNNLNILFGTYDMRLRKVVDELNHSIHHGISPDYYNSGDYDGSNDSLMDAQFRFNADEDKK